jgi:uncharacterized protein YecE (DUF72 family)
VAARAWIGTSGWNYKHWRETIYPKGLPQRRWLEHYLVHFDTVEVNTSFYRIPKRETVEAWREATPSFFRFALKLWRGITHYRKLKNAGEFTSSFLGVVEAMPRDRRAPLLIQLPPSQGRDIEKLRAYVLELREIAESPWPIAVEFRNGSWLDADVYRTLDKLDVAMCIHDMRGRAASDRPNEASFVYVRRHGSAGGRYAGSYSPEQIAVDASHIQRWVRDGRGVYVYYNNDIGGHAFWNARDLRSAISSESP